MEKKTIVVVGAGKGVGNHVAEKFAQNEFRVIFISRNEAHLAAYEKEFEKKGYEVYTKAADAADTTTLDKAFDWVLKQFGVVDVLVYNTAILTGGKPTELTAEDLMKHFRVDVASALFCVKKVIPAQASIKNGTILLTGGGLALYPMADYTCISVDKAALRTLAYVLNEELKEQGIFTGIVTIKGNVQEGTEYDPRIIAEKYWHLYVERSEVEIVY